MARCSSRIPSSRPRAARRPGGGWSTTTSGGRSSSGCRARRICTAKRSVASIRAMGSGTCSVTVLVRSMGAYKGVETSALRFAQRGSVDADGVALVTQPAEQRLDERLVAQEVRPLGVVQIGGDRPRMMHLPSRSLRGLLLGRRRGMLAAELAEALQLRLVGEHRPLSVDPPTLDQAAAK